MERMKNAIALLQVTRSEVLEVNTLENAVLSRAFMTSRQSREIEVQDCTKC